MGSNVWGQRSWEPCYPDATESDLENQGAYFLEKRWMDLSLWSLHRRWFFFFSLYFKALPGEPVSTHPADTCVCKPVTALGLRPRIALSSAQAK